jgi:hypothetical protein
MKKFLVNCWPVALLLFVLVASCGKEKSLEEDTSQYFIKCKIGGVDKTFNVSAAGVKQDVGSGAMSYSVFGKAIKDPANLESIGFTIQIYIPLVAGTYKETDPTTDYYLAGIYNPNTTDATAIYASMYDDNDPFQITFTSVTTTTLAGTFKGTLFINSTDPNADSTAVTEGSFKVKLQ